MKRSLLFGLLAVACVIDPTVSVAQQAGAPRGYIFFAPRDRASAKARAEARARAIAKARAEAAAKGETKFSPAIYSRPDTMPAKPTATTAASPASQTSAEPKVRQATWGTVYSSGYSWPGTGAWYGYSSYGTPYAYPLGGYAYDYNWAGQCYSAHCYSSGLRGSCYRPGWNDAGYCGFERRCGRGSLLDCFWHMGGYERQCCDPCCPYPCEYTSSRMYGNYSSRWSADPAASYLDPCCPSTGTTTPAPKTAPGTSGNTYSPDSTMPVQPKPGDTVAPPKPSDTAVPPQPYDSPIEAPKPKPEA